MHMSHISWIMKIEKKLDFSKMGGPFWLKEIKTNIVQLYNRATFLDATIEVSPSG